MKISRVCALLLLLVMGSALAFADSLLDPKVIVHGVNGGSSPDSCEQCKGVGVNFSFTIGKSGRDYFYFTNESGKNWTSLTLIENGVPANDISCQQSFFLNCTTKTLKNGSVEILMSGIRGGLNARKGILNGQSFVIGFACNPGCWQPGTVTAHAGTTPEPGTVALMVTGLGGLFCRRKYWRNRFNA